MRGIAEKAGVSLGNAYYYFSSKEELIQGFYLQMHRAHQEAAEQVLQETNRFAERLQRVFEARQETAQEYHQFAVELFRTAANPSSPLSPFSGASEPTRLESIDLFRQVVEGSKESFPADLREVLPELLWLLQMALVLYWVHDSSPGTEKSSRLIDRSVTLTARFLSVIKRVPFKPIRSMILKTYKEFRD